MWLCVVLSCLKFVEPVFFFFAPLQAIYQFHLLLLAEFVTGVGK